jgi:uncharacterized peroxidase-related enzyme
MSTSEYAVASGLKQLGKGPFPTHLPVIEEADATGEIAEAYQYFRDHFGRPTVPGILKCFSSSPAMLRIIIQLGSTLVFSEGVLGRRMKEMIATYVSSLNECPYCLDSHAASLCGQGGAEALMNALVKGDLGDVSISTPEGYLLEFVRKVTVESYQVADTDILNLRASGWDEKQIAESIHVAAMFACFNRVANAFGLPSQDLLGHLHDTGRSKHEEDTSINEKTS